MKNSKLSRASLSVFGIFCFSALLVAAEIHTAKIALDLKKEVAESRAAASRAGQRADVLTELLGRISEELERAKNLPVELSPNAESLATAIENCATAAGVSCAVSEEGEKDGKITLDVTCHARAGEFLTFMRGLLARRETFFIERTESRATGDGLNVQLRLSAFVKAEAR